MHTINKICTEEWKINSDVYKIGIPYFFEKQPLLLFISVTILCGSVQGRDFMIFYDLYVTKL